MRQDVFIAVGREGVLLPDSFPYTITMMMEDGTFKEQTIRTRRDIDLRKAVAVKLHKPSAIEVLAATTAAELGITNADRIVGLKTVLYHLLDKGLLKVDGQPSAPAGPDWLDRKMDQLGVFMRTNRKAVRDWFENPAKYPECPYDLQNAILTVKPSGNGRVVVLPTGHTIAYTTAREIYWKMLGYNTGYCETRPTVGEYLGRRSGIRYTSTHRLTVDKNGASVGCQFVPREAIVELAQREGWAEKPPC